jgi:penicillin-binding protein 1A
VPPRRPADFPLTNRRRRLERRRARRRGKWIGAVSLVVVLLGTGIGFAAAGLGGPSKLRRDCELDRLQPVTLGANSFLYARDGSFLGTIPAEKNRQPVGLREISPWMRKATLAIEDRRFYGHSGVDFEGIARAAWADLRARKAVQGGSTITQQLVRNLYPISRKRTLRRKLTEACLALRLDRARSKEWIFREYLNVVYYGNRAYGIQAAARTYFDRKSRNLTLPQAALLAGLTQAPSRYNPFNSPERATRRRNVVLRAMLENRDIDRAQYEQAVSQPLGLRRGVVYDKIRQPYFFNYVYDELVREYGAGTVRSGGLRVYTTIDPRYQRLAKQAIRDTLYLKTDPASAIVSINPANGAIRAMTAVIPGRRKHLQFNLAAQARRQAGSTFKTFVLTTAVSQGVDPDSTSYDSEYFVYRPDPDGTCENERAWCVETYDGSYVGSISISSATLRSDNTVFAKLTLDLGPQRVAWMAKRLGIKTPLEPLPSLGLGSIEVSPLEMASAYATLAAGGIYSEPMAIRKVVFPDGKEDTEAGWGVPERKRVIADWVAAEVTEILEENMQPGQGTGGAAYIGRTAAGKTGTTDFHTDAWFCGYTPNLSTTVWVGYPHKNIPMESVQGISVAGGTFPAEIWNRYMSKALAPSPPREFPSPQTSPNWRSFSGQYANESGYDYDYDYDYGSDYDSSPEEEEPEPERRPPPPAPPKPTPPSPPPPLPPPPAPVAPPAAPPPVTPPPEPPEQLIP